MKVIEPNVIKSSPSHLMGRLWKFKKDEVDEWVKATGAAEPKKKDSKK